MDTTAFTKDGKYLMLALDHRGSFRKLVNLKNPDEVDPFDAIEAKKSIIEAVFTQMSGLLIDMDFGLEAYATANYIKPKPFLLAMEVSGYTEENGERFTTIENSAHALKEQGALGTKLLIYINHKSQSTKKQIETVKTALKDSHDEGLPFFLEIVTYGETGGEVVEALAAVLQEGVKPDVFKLEYPGNEQNCKAITEVLGKTPWIMLTRGDNFNDFTNKLQIACKNGCSGFLAGRALWQEYFSLKEEGDKEKFLKKTLPERFKRISEIAL
ncbi:2-deoxy-5-keto-D-gluconate 6-phosphate aldolase domain-containing protein [Patescibacteria group bacterium]